MAQKKARPELSRAMMGNDKAARREALLDMLARMGCPPAILARARKEKL